MNLIWREHATWARAQLESYGIFPTVKSEIFHWDLARLSIRSVECLRYIVMLDWRNLSSLS